MRLKNDCLSDRLYIATKDGELYSIIEEFPNGSMLLKNETSAVTYFKAAANCSFDKLGHLDWLTSLDDDILEYAREACEAFEDIYTKKCSEFEESMTYIDLTQMPLYKRR